LRRIEALGRGVERERLVLGLVGAARLAKVRQDVPGARQTAARCTHRGVLRGIAVKLAEHGLRAAQRSFQHQAVPLDACPSRIK